MDVYTICCNACVPDTHNLYLDVHIRITCDRNFIQVFMIARLNKGGLLHIFTSTGFVVVMIPSTKSKQRVLFDFILHRWEPWSLPDWHATFERHHAMMIC